MTILTASRRWCCECGQAIQPGEQFGIDNGIFHCEDCLTKPDTEAQDKDCDL